RVLREGDHGQRRPRVPLEARQREGAAAMTKVFRDRPGEEARIRTMIRFAAIALLMIGCQNEPSKLDGKKAGSGTSGNSELETSLHRIEDRLKALEDSHKIGAPG